MNDFFALLTFTIVVGVMVNLVCCLFCSTASRLLASFIAAVLTGVLVGLVGVVGCFPGLIGGLLGGGFCAIVISGAASRRTKNTPACGTGLLPVVVAGVLHEDTSATKDKLDEQYLSIIGSMLAMAKQLPEEERRSAVLEMFKLPAKTTDEEAEVKLRGEINDSFEQPIDPLLLEKLIGMILSALK